jgi:hypothetical protein
VGLIHHSDRGVRYLSIRYTERLAEAGIEASVGSRGDPYDNALSESVIDRYKTDVIRQAGPWRRLEDVEFATLEWVAWFSTCRLLEPLRYAPPAEYEEQSYRAQAAQAELVAINEPRLLQTRGGSGARSGRASRRSEFLHVGWTTAELHCGDAIPAAAFRTLNQPARLRRVFGV